MERKAGSPCSPCDNRNNPATNGSVAGFAARSLQIHLCRHHRRDRPRYRVHRQMMCPAQRRLMDHQPPDHIHSHRRDIYTFSLYILQKNLIKYYALSSWTEPEPASGLKAALVAPQTGQRHSSGRSAKAVPFFIFPLRSPLSGL